MAYLARGKTPSTGGKRLLTREREVFSVEINNSSLSLLKAAANGVQGLELFDVPNYKSSLAARPRFDLTCTGFDLIIKDCV